jgi:hypothetical protein
MFNLYPLHVTSYFFTQWWRTKCQSNRSYTFVHIHMYTFISVLRFIRFVLSLWVVVFLFVCFSFACFIVWYGQSYRVWYGQSYRVWYGQSYIVWYGQSYRVWYVVVFLFVCFSFACFLFRFYFILFLSLFTNIEAFHKIVRLLKENQRRWNVYFCVKKIIHEFQNFTGQSI